MSDHRYFRKLERPADVESVWASAEHLTADTLPDWLTIEDRPDYRRCDCPRFDTLSEQQQATFLRELKCWEDRGFVVELIGGQHAIHMPAPPREAVWSIAVCTGASLQSLSPAGGRLTRDDVTDVPASGVADPFLFRHGRVWHLFFEVINWAAYQGEIGHAVSTDGRTWQYDRIVLREPFHLSYPYVFEHDGEIWMIPETHEADSIRLYRAVHFPTQWEFTATLVEGKYLADASIVHWQGHWYLFADKSREGLHDMVRLYVSERLHGPWREHPQSPVRRHDPFNSRPAGRIIFDGLHLIRFAQNSLPAYGTDVRAFTILELTPTAYAEQPLQKAPILGPSGTGWNADGMHHIDAHRLPDGTWLAAVDGWYLPATEVR